MERGEMESETFLCIIQPLNLEVKERKKGVLLKFDEEKFRKRERKWGKEKLRREEEDYLYKLLNYRR